MSKCKSTDMEDHLFQTLSVPPCADRFLRQKVTMFISFCKTLQKFVFRLHLLAVNKDSARSNNL